MLEYGLEGCRTLYKALAQSTHAFNQSVLPLSLLGGRRGGPPLESIGRSCCAGHGGKTWVNRQPPCLRQGLENLRHEGRKGLIRVPWKLRWQLLKETVPMEAELEKLRSEYAAFHRCPGRAGNVSQPSSTVSNARQATSAQLGQQSRTSSDLNRWLVQ